MLLKAIRGINAALKIDWNLKAMKVVKNEGPENILTNNYRLAYNGIREQSFFPRESWLLLKSSRL